MRYLNYAVVPVRRTLLDFLKNGPDLYFGWHANNESIPKRCPPKLVNMPGESLRQIVKDARPLCLDFDIERGGVNVLFLKNEKMVFLLNTKNGRVITVLDKFKRHQTKSKEEKKEFSHKEMREKGKREIRNFLRQSA